MNKMETAANAAALRETAYCNKAPQFEHFQIAVLLYLSYQNT